jgi:hypothetical protein
MVLAVLGAKDAAAAGRLLGSQLSPIQGVISADLNGDRQSDMATTGTGRRDSHGYFQDVTVRLSSSEFSTLTVHTARLVERLSVRDLDGDTDRDLVLEAFDREPLAILLNDGEGHFHLANLEHFRSHDRPGTPSLESSIEELHFPELSQGPANPTAAVAIPANRHILASARLLASDHHRGVPAFYFHYSGRGPPAFLN